ncbi:hypothetical protein A2U01_0103594 [Trifolium medium]|uniref:Uncharacterized protein n=1 Tax=Trifolium medium TaxID=97028 RepID=A0A392V785_9FABA|nr:hypothetical protein [Trifolium medium]
MLDESEGGCFDGGGGLLKVEDGE